MAMNEAHLLQLVVSGDFCQLPPVPNRDENGVPIPALFAFEASSWNKCIKYPILLTKVFRQRDQGLFCGFTPSAIAC